ncbi:MAG: SH3 domain-containing protein [Francisellaceae bacterium]
MRKILVLWFFILIHIGYSADVPISLFDLSPYSQKTSDWIKPESIDYHQPLISDAEQQIQLKKLYDHSFGAASPWGEKFVMAYLKQNNLYDIEYNLLQKFNNQRRNTDNLIYRVNFRPYPNEIWQQIKDNMKLEQFKSPSYFQQNRRAIVVNATIGRDLPTTEPLFYSFTQPGEGYPFDNLMMTSLQPGQAIYILGKSVDEAWSLVLADSYINWVKTQDIAPVSTAFIIRWQKQAKSQMLTTIHFNSSIISDDHKIATYAYPGALFPMLNRTKDRSLIYFPIRSQNGDAQIITATIKNQNGVAVPLPTTPANFAFMLNALKGNPYGWGNLYFFNDCSAEINAIYKAFGIWLPRNSIDQATAYKHISLDHLSPKQRIDYLLKYGKPLFSFVYINGHVFIYIGKAASPFNKDEIVPMTYQQIWGLSDDQRSMRAVIGKSVFLPLLMSYPQNPNLSLGASGLIIDFVYPYTKSNRLSSAA